MLIAMELLAESTKYARTPQKERTEDSAGPFPSRVGNLDCGSGASHTALRREPVATLFGGQRGRPTNRNTGVDDTRWLLAVPIPPPGSGVPAAGAQAGYNENQRMARGCICRAVLAKVVAELDS
ncbi:hypothetical protein GCM10011610_69600 [Nocardia rhizosphaerihabitans]|uniref:Uncharacterized protein n=1 Tax=Nocardia rhizosphaerihabitans TaxID=1691570 RepID=A0ABQ2L4T7_9NOCA|nr:hypothetical protein GCM10011610_69600 [Nocardia rhizosphaerihabitans]